MMDYKLEYISRLFQKTSHKAIENYVITRLWHKLDNDRVKMLPQQYINRHEDKYALTDVYFPQVKLHVEVNEPAHYASEERIAADRLRKSEIEKNTGHKVYVIDCRKSLPDIHNDIDKIVSEIHQTISEQVQRNEFKPWNPDDERNPEYWKEKGFISAKDDISFDTVEDICALFDTRVPKMGFLRKGGTAHPQDTTVHIWWPSINNKNFCNKLSSDDEEIIEYSNDERKRAGHIQYVLSHPVDRLTFVKYTDVLGFSGYKFKGIYRLDKEATSSEKGLVWKRVATDYQIQNN